MTEFEIVRSMLLHSMPRAPKDSPLSGELCNWVRANADWLFDEALADVEELDEAELLDAVRSASARPSQREPVMRIAAQLGDLLALDPVDCRIVDIAIAWSRLAHPAELIRIIGRTENLAKLLGELAGCEPQDAERRVRKHPLSRFGLLQFKSDPVLGNRIEIGWMLANLLDRTPMDRSETIESLVGPRQFARFPVDSFAQAEDAEFLVRLLQGAAEASAPGINILFYGPPGTGKTELARAIAAAAGIDLFGVGEARDDGEEPDRWDRIGALLVGFRLLGNQSRTAMLFDEMEDLVTASDAPTGFGHRNRPGSKVYVNRMLETNPVPVIWTTNTIANVDRAVLRRMSFILEVPYPTRKAAQFMLNRIAEEEGVEPDKQLADLVDAMPETAAVLRNAARATRLAGEASGGSLPARSLVRVLRGEEPRVSRARRVDLDLYECETPIGDVFDRICESGRSDVSLLLSGPPGTGKTALAGEFAKQLDKPMIVKRSSDLLSKWVGETEHRIAAAFAEARREKAVLFFDEADSLLFDRSDAHTSWEVGQVNELLSQLDVIDAPVVAATNYQARFDPAALRRFVFKIELMPLTAERAALCFRRFFKLEAPSGLKELTNLTPGDFAMVARQLDFTGKASPDEILARLAAEGDAKPVSLRRSGF